MKVCSLKRDIMVTLVVCCCCTYIYLLSKKYHLLTKLKLLRLRSDHRLPWICCVIYWPTLNTEKGVKVKQYWISYQYKEDIAHCFRETKRRIKCTQYTVISFLYLYGHNKM